MQNNYGIRAGTLIEIDTKEAWTNEPKVVVMCLADIDRLDWWHAPMALLYNG